MKKRNILRMVCMILLVATLLTVTAADCEDPTCEEKQWTPEELLNEYVRRANEMIMVQCCHDSPWGLTRKALNENLFNFVFIQEKFSGKKLCKIEETTYYYPKYVHEWEDKYRLESDSIRYRVYPLEKNDIGLYTGIRITAFDSDTPGKVDAMNELLKKYSVFSRYKDDVEKLHEAYKQFQSKYSGKLLCVDEFKGEIHCPNYTWEEQKTLPENSESGNYVVLFDTAYRCGGEHGFYTGIMIHNFLQPVDDDYTANSREIVYWKKSMSHKYAEEPRYDPDERHEGQSSLEFPDIYMMPDINVNLK